VIPSPLNGYVTPLQRHANLTIAVDAGTNQEKILIAF